MILIKNILQNCSRFGFLCLKLFLLCRSTEVQFKDPLIQIKYEYSALPDNPLEEKTTFTFTGQEETQIMKKPAEFKCPKCGKCFKSRFQIKTHLEQQHKDPNEWKWRCAECNKKFATSGYLRSHMERHLNEKSLECQYCHKQFALRKNLRYHLARMHRNPSERNKMKNLEDYYKRKPFKCRYCDVRYGRKHNLTKHYKEKHWNEAGYDKLGISGESKTFFECEICKRKLSDLYKKEFHFRHNHDLSTNSEVEIVKCDQSGCTAYFLKLDQLKLHRRLEHGGKNGVNKRGKLKDKKFLRKKRGNVVNIKTDDVNMEVAKREAEISIEIKEEINVEMNFNEVEIIDQNLIDPIISDSERENMDNTSGALINNEENTFGRSSEGFVNANFVQLEDLD